MNKNFLIEFFRVCFFCFRRRCFLTPRALIVALMLVNAELVIAQDIGRSENPLILTPPAPPGDREFRKHFVQSLYDIAHGKFDAHQISNALDWPIVEHGKSKYAGLKKTSFMMYEKFGNPSFSQYDIGVKEFTADLRPAYICILGSDVLGKFGFDFERSVWNVDTHWQGQVEKPKEPLPEVKKNFDIFSWGPRYKVAKVNSITIIFFDFKDSICANGFSIRRSNE